MNKHLTKKVLNEVDIEKAKATLEKYNEEFQVDFQKYYKNPKTTDVYIKAQKDGNKLVKATFIYDKEKIRFDTSILNKNGGASSSSNSYITGMGPEDVVKKYNSYKEKFIDKTEEKISLINQGDYNISDFTKFQQESLEMHNKYRKDHHVPALELNKELCEIAQKYADYLAKNKLFEHSHARFKGCRNGRKFIYVQWI